MTLRHTVRGGDYDRQRADSVRVTIRENDTRGIIVVTPPNDMDLDEHPDNCRGWNRHRTTVKLAMRSRWGS